MHYFDFSCFDTNAEKKDFIKYLFKYHYDSVSQDLDTFFTFVNAIYAQVAEDGFEDVVFVGNKKSENKWSYEEHRKRFLQNLAKCYKSLKSEFPDYFQTTPDFGMDDLPF